MVWSQYKEDADAAVVDTVPPPPLPLLTPPGGAYFGRRTELRYDDWASWYSADLMNMWSGIQAYRVDAQISGHMLEYASYSDFCEFCFALSSQKQNKW